MSTINSVKSIDNPMIDHLGELHYRVKANHRTDDTYSLVKDVPVLRYSSIVDSIIAITEVDNRLYDIENLKYIEAYNEDGESFDLSNLSFKSVVVSHTGQLVLALTNNGDLYQGIVAINSCLRDFELVDSKVRFITRNDGDYLISVSEHSMAVRQEYGCSILHLPKNQEVIDVQSRILITHDNLIVIGDNGLKMIPYKHRLICCGIVAICYGQHGEVHRYIAIMEEDNGELITRFNNVNDYHTVVDEIEEVIIDDNNEVNDDDQLEEVNEVSNDDDISDEVYNSELIRMHHQSPWTEMIIIGDAPHLLNLDGVIIEIREDWAIIGTKIPFNILSTNNRIKSMR